MSDIIICSIKTNYIDYLRSFSKLYNVYDNKEDHCVHTRKYLGIVQTIGDLKYYVPLSSPKDTDYINTPNGKFIRNSVLPIMRIVVDDISGNLELKGTLRIGNMIPIPDNVIIPYIISCEPDQNYRILVEKEYEFIKSNRELICKNSQVIYSQKINEAIYYGAGENRPAYLDHVVDFKYAEEKCNEYIILNP